jgi:thiol:disulfide interchange protein DsbC
MKRLLAALLTLALALPALAQSNEATLRKTLEDRLKLKVEKVGKTPVAGLYEVIADGRLMYTDEKGAYLFMGDLFDTRTQKNLSAEKRFSLLPLDGAIKMVRGNGKNVLVTFEDPNCGYCKKLVRELQGVKDITIYTFLLPVLSEDSVTKSRAIWCSADRAKAWTDWMSAGVQPAAASDKCDANPMLERNSEIAQQLEIRGTPFLMFANGSMARGYIPAGEIEKRFSRVGG